MSIDVSKISETDGRIIARQFLKILERDFENPAIRADFENGGQSGTEKEYKTIKGRKDEEKEQQTKRKKKLN